MAIYLLLSLSLSVCLSLSLSLCFSLLLCTSFCMFFFIPSLSLCLFFLSLCLFSLSASWVEKMVHLLLYKLHNNPTIWLKHQIWHSQKKKERFWSTNRGGSIARLCLICHRLCQRPCSVMRAVKSSPQAAMIYVYRYTYMYVRTYIGICTHISDMSSRLKTSFFYFCAILFGFCATRCRGTLRPKLTRSTAMGSAVPTVWESRARVGRNRLTNQGLAVLP